ncbi:MAG: hypothetical protein RMJ33_08850 [Saprospiraceae bacterium]|nr:hypothetical protein [Saprospiraceae bacterium]
MKVLLIIVGAIALLVVSLLLFVRLGIRTTKFLLAEYAENGDRIALEYHYTSDWGNSYAAAVLLFNGKQVDVRGRLYGSEDESSKAFPVRPADVQKLHPEILLEIDAPIFAALERLRRRGAPWEYSKEYRPLQAQHPQKASWTPWTVWVRPGNFSPEEYARLNALLRKGCDTLIAQQCNAKTNLSGRSLGLYDWDGRRPLAIWRTVYFDYAQLKTEVYERQTPEKKERIEVTPAGDVLFHHESALYVAGYGCGLGMLNDTGDTLLVGQAWKYTDHPFPVSELSAFRDAQGRALTEVYAVIEEPEIAN